MYRALISAPGASFLSLSPPNGGGGPREHTPMPILPFSLSFFLSTSLFLSFPPLRSPLPRVSPRLLAFRPPLFLLFLRAPVPPTLTPATFFHGLRPPRLCGALLSLSPPRRRRPRARSILTQPCFALSLFPHCCFDSVCVYASSIYSNPPSFVLQLVFCAVETSGRGGYAQRSRFRRSVNQRHPFPRPGRFSLPLTTPRRRRNERACTLLPVFRFPYFSLPPLFFTFLPAHLPPLPRVSHAPPTKLFRPSFFFISIRPPLHRPFFPPGKSPRLCWSLLSLPTPRRRGPARDLFPPHAACFDSLLFSPLAVVLLSVLLSFLPTPLCHHIRLVFCASRHSGRVVMARAPVPTVMSRATHSSAHGDSFLSSPRRAAHGRL